MKSSGIDIETLNLMSIGDVCRYLNLSHSTVFILTKKHNIPHKNTSAGKIYLKEDIDAFQLARADRLKFRKNEPKKLPSGKFPS